MSYGLSQRLEREIYEEGYSVSTRFISADGDEHAIIEFYVEEKKLLGVFVEVTDNKARINVVDTQNHINPGVLYPQTEVDELAYLAIKQFKKHGIPKVNVNF